MSELITEYPGTAATPVITWARTFPAAPAQVGEARRFLAGLLDGGPAADDAILCLSELASNATQHSRSARPGGQFTVRAQLDGPHLRVEVADAGGPWAHPADADPPPASHQSRPNPRPASHQSRPNPRPASHQHGRGLTIVAALSRGWGVSDTSDGGRVVWFELALPPPAPTT
jgi:anti-sigma regulatory factor (Ser/Thr protein kinase)